MKTAAVLIASTLVLVFTHNAAAAPPTDSLDMIHALLLEQASEIEKWQTISTVLFALTFVVGMLGIMTGLLQGWNTKTAKILTVACGAIVSMITLVLNSASDTDYKTLSAKADQAQKIIAKARLLEAQQLPDADRKAVVKLISEQLDEIDKLKDEVKLGPIKYVLVRKAKAQASNEPEWTTKPPTDDENLYFVGVADDSSLAKAKADAEVDGKQAAADDLTRRLTKPIEQQGGVKPDDIAKYVVSSARLVDSYFNYDSAKHLYRYYCLLKIRRDLAGTQVKLYGAREGINLPSDLEAGLHHADAVGDAYAVRKLTTYRQQLDAARNSVPPDLYQKFLEGRTLRKKKEFDKAIALLEDVTARAPSFYMAWYNLALACDDGHQPVKADHAYREAANLEVAQSLGDASLYNSYGVFLIEQLRYADAIPQLQKALQIEPNHPKAAANLKAAQAGSQGQ